MKLKIFEKTRKKSSHKKNKYLVVEIKKDGKYTIAVKYKDNIYYIHPYMFLLSDRTTVYASRYNTHHKPYTESERECKTIYAEEISMIYWLPYKPGQKMQGEIINDMFYDNKRAIKLKSISTISKVSEE